MMSRYIGIVIRSEEVRHPSDTIGIYLLEDPEAVLDLIRSSGISHGRFLFTDVRDATTLGSVKIPAPREGAMARLN